MNNGIKLEQLTSEDINDNNKSQNEFTDSKSGKLTQRQLVSYLIYLIICSFFVYYAIYKSNQYTSLYEENRQLARKLDSLMADEHDKGQILKEAMRKRIETERLNQSLKDRGEKIQAEISLFDEKYANNKIEYEKCEKELLNLKLKNEELNRERWSLDNTIIHFEEQLVEYEKRKSDLKTSIELLNL